MLRKDHENMAAILFLIDRYIYWQGGSQTLLNIVDSIMKEKPELPIAPQLVIRKARVLQTSGNLQGEVDETFFHIKIVLSYSRALKKNMRFTEIGKLTGQMYLFSFVETPRKFIIAELSIR